MYILGDIGNTETKLCIVSKNNQILGTIILSIEGINGTVSGPVKSIDSHSDLLIDEGYKCNIKISKSEKKTF